MMITSTPRSPRSVTTIASDYFSHMNCAPVLRSLRDVLRLVNNGRLTALNVRVRLNEDFIESLDFKEIKEILRNQRNKMCIIGAGQHFDIPVGGAELRDNSNLKPIRGMVTYEGGGNQYETEIDIDLENYMTIFPF